MKSIRLYIISLLAFFCAVSISQAAGNSAEAWNIESGHEDEISAVFDSENVQPAPDFKVESIRIENGIIDVQINGGGRKARLFVRNGADDSEAACRNAAGLRLCLQANSDGALSADYIDWLLPRLSEKNLAGIWGRKAVPVPESKYGGITQSRLFLKILFAFWPALLAVMIAFLFLRKNSLSQVPPLARPVLRGVAWLIFTALCLAFIGAVFSGWPYFR
mgnify:CR=1 FL=1